MNTPGKRLSALLLILLAVADVARGEVGPEALESVVLADRAGIQRYHDRIMLITAEKNYVAHVIASELKLLLAYDRDIFVRHAEPRLHGNCVVDSEVEKDWMAAVARRAEDGDPFYMVVLGGLHYDMEGYAYRDQEKARYWWEKAAGLNSGLAKLELGKLAMNRRAGIMDRAKAESCFREAGTLGVPEGWYEAGGFSARVKDGVQDWSEVMVCYGKAAMAGHSRAQYELGRQMYHGVPGVAQDKAGGERWLRTAASNGVEDARKYLAEHVDRVPPRRDYLKPILDIPSDIQSVYLAYDMIGEHLKDAKVVIVCLVEEYTPTTALPPRGQWDASNMLDLFLGGARRLKSGEGAVKPEAVKVLVVECWVDARVRADEFGKKLGLRGYDYSLPAMFVFKDGEHVWRYTYEESPGEDGGDLVALLKYLFSGEYDRDRKSAKGKVNRSRR
jgi:hypothetical protein